MSRPTAERSRAYPILSLEESGLAISDILNGLGSGSFSREVLAETLGYSNAHGGPGARKIAALTQYGLLRRTAGLYSPTTLAQSVVGPGDETERRMALHRALRQPPLFRALLERYAPQGRIPRQLASVLWQDHGITRKASRPAAETFRESARYAGVLASDGSFLPYPAEEGRPRKALRPESDKADSPRFENGSPASPEQRFEFPLTAGKVASLCLPWRLKRRDLEIVKRQIELLEYQVADEEEDGDDDH